MANPLTPDFDRNSNPGRLVTDRFDFALHYEGVAFRHDATMIDLKPDLTIGADFCTTVQEALEALTGLIGPSPFTLATVGTTTANLGIVTLGGDFGGTALIPRVTSIQGRAISTLPPSNGNVLIWSSSTGWTPTPFSGVFTAGKDLSGSSTLQTVVGLQGNPISALTPSSGNVLTWNVSTGWTPEPSTSIFTASRDLSGTNTSQTVIGLQGNPVSALTPNSGYVLTWNVSTGWTPEASTGSFVAGGDLSGTDISQHVIGLQGNAIEAQTLGAGQDQYILTWNNSTSNWQALPNAGGGAGGITTLTGDVTAGPGSGSQAASVVRIRGNPVSATAPTAGQYLIENASVTGSAWTTLAGDVSNSTSIPGNISVIGIRNISVPVPSGTNRVLQYNSGAYTWAAAASTTTTGTGLWHNIGGNLQAAALIGTAGQFVVANTTPDAAFVTISGDATASVSVPGQLTNVGLRGITVPVPTGTNTVLQYNSGAYSWATVSGGGSFTPGSDLLGNSTSTSTNQYVSSISYSASSAGGSVAVNGTNTLLNWATNAITLRQASTTLVQLKSTSTDFIRFGASPGSNGNIRATTNSVVIGVNSTAILQTDGSPATYLGGTTGIFLQVAGATQANLTTTSLSLTPSNLLFTTASGGDANITFTGNGSTAGTSLSITAQSAGSGNSNGGGLILATGSKSGSGVVGTMQFFNGGTQSMDLTTTALSLLSPTIQFTNTGGGTNLINFANSSASGSGANLTIQAQTGASGHFGGGLTLQAGTAGSSSEGGNVNINSGIGTVPGGIYFNSGSSTPLASFTQGGPAVFNSSLVQIVWSGVSHRGDSGFSSTASFNFQVYEPGAPIVIEASTTITLTSSMSACPIIAFTSAPIDSSCFIVVPNNIGAIWFFDFSQVTLSGGTITIGTGSGYQSIVGTGYGGGTGLITVAVTASNRVVINIG